MEITLTLSTGKEIKLTDDEFNELKGWAQQSNPQPNLQPIQIPQWVPDPFPYGVMPGATCGNAVTIKDLSHEIKFNDEWNE